MPDWSGLLPDILFTIAKRIDDVQDFNSFGSVCRTWRAVMLREGSAISLQPLRWLMFRPRHGDGTIREIYNFTRNKVRRVYLPAEATKGWLTLTNGWIVIVYPNHEMSLLHLFSRRVIPLQTLTAFSRTYVKKAVLSLSPFLSPNDYTLMIIHGMRCRLAFWKPEDQAWTLIETYNAPFQDIIYHKGRFYAIDELGIIYVCDVRLRNHKVAMSIARIPVEAAFSCFYLVGKTDNQGSLLIVIRNEDNQTSIYKVYEIDLCGKGGVEEIDDLGARTIFVSHGDSVCVEDSKFPPGIVDDDYMNFHCSESYLCPYGCPISKHPHKRGIYMPIYNLKDKKVEDFFYSLES